jgi:hypothetical protein
MQIVTWRINIDQQNEVAVVLKIIVTDLEDFFMDGAKL